MAAALVTVNEFLARVRSADVQSMTADLSEEEAGFLLEEIVGAASDDFRGYAAKRYGEAITATDQVKRFVVQIAWFDLCRRMGWNYSEADERDEKRLRDRLGMIAKHQYDLIGQADKADPDRLTSARETEPSARVAGRRRTMTRETLKDY
ncbi:hypothetical protein KDL45_13330 [bacterium]|nr:hypothetical protein [bacterium]